MSSWMCCCKAKSPMDFSGLFMVRGRIVTKFQNAIMVRNWPRNGYQAREIRRTGLPSSQRMKTNATQSPRESGWKRIIQSGLSGAICCAVLFAGTTTARAFVIAATQQIDFNGKNVTTDSFDSANPNYSTNGLYPTGIPSMQKDNGDVATDYTILSSINAGNAKIKGHVRTGQTGA